MKDLLIVGGGPAGYAAAVRAAQLGMQVALVEREALGGTCLNWGCIPTKVMYEAACLKKNIKKAAGYGLNAGEPVFNAKTLIDKRNQIVHGLRDGIAGLLRKYSVEVLQGSFSFQNGAAAIDGRAYSAAKVLLACGAKDDMPVFPGCELPEVISSKQLLLRDSMPQRLVIYGGGVAGAEFASIFATLGCDVSIVKTGKRFFPFMDDEIDKRIPTYLKRCGVQLQTGMRLKQTIKRGSLFKCIFEDITRDSIMELETEALLITKGRIANTDSLGLASSGIETDARGFITVDADYQTTRRDIFAVGDVTGKRMLAHAASEEAVTAVERMTGMDSSVNYDAIPNCVFMFPQVASVGRSEQEAAAQGILGGCGKFMFSGLGRAQTTGEIDGFVKTICDQSGRIIGVHMIGPEVSELVACAATALHTKMSAEKFSKIVQAHPTLAESLRESAQDVLHRGIQ